MCYLSLGPEAWRNNDDEKTTCVEVNKWADAEPPNGSDTAIHDLLEIWLIGKNMISF